ncbi:dihydroxy-acid dehydratase [Vibrio sp. DW001]|uniref:dihydroxy-acid dehydratase domain-containing protein n=1 Tax=Vibrio sp. DW001 TaxID=2912315 RepID=UPI0023AF5D33|nr:dihydroxy-acid dehydratase [Vibrio sp. DW001]WED26750.1 dihydroxy-acid dehydratase [Vibrio sp. DW001]
MMCNSKLDSITQQIVERSANTRANYLERLKLIKNDSPSISEFESSNAAHLFAGLDPQRKLIIQKKASRNLGIISSYNEMVSAHVPYGEYPNIIKDVSIREGHSAAFIGGVPAICDGIVQGYSGMEASLISRDIIAMSTAVPLACDVSDCAVLLGTCDKIVPGMLIGALSRGYLPVAFLPSGPMSTGISNSEKSKARQKFHEGTIDSDSLLDVECKCYHGHGTCTFFGTANTNQVMLEAIGLQLIDTGLSPVCGDKRQLISPVVKSLLKEDAPALYDVVTEQSIVNACVVWLATGGSTNHTIHMVAIARAAGIDLRWEDIDALSEIVPLLARIYPNGQADVNAFHAAGGVSSVMKQLIKLKLLHEEAICFNGQTLSEQLDRLNREITDNEIIAAYNAPFNLSGGIKLLSGNLGEGIMKVSSVEQSRLIVKAPARVFISQQDVYNAYVNGSLWTDVVVVVKNQGRMSNGMPELHKLIPLLSNIYDRGYQVALVTDGRLSGASGKIPSVVHVTPEAKRSGQIGLIKDGDLIEVNGVEGTLHCSALSGSQPVIPDSSDWSSQDIFDLLRLTSSHPSNGSMSYTDKIS